MQFKLVRNRKRSKWTLEVPEVTQDVIEQLAVIKKLLADKATKEDKLKGLEIGASMLDHYPLEHQTILNLETILFTSCMPPAIVDVPVMMEAANLLSQIAMKQQSSMRTDLVITKLDRAMEWLLRSPESAQRHEALLLLSCLSRDVPDVFEDVVLQQENLPYLRTVISFLQEAKPVVKEHAAEALGRSLAIFNQYELVDSSRLFGLYELLDLMESTSSESVLLGAALALEQVLRFYKRASVVRTRLCVALHAANKLYDSRHSSLQRIALTLTPLTVPTLQTVAKAIQNGDKAYEKEMWGDTPDLLKSTEDRAVRCALRMAVRERDRDRVFLFNVWGPLMGVMGEKMYASDPLKCKAVWDLLEETLATGHEGEPVTSAALKCLTIMVNHLGTFLCGSYADMIGACCNPVLGDAVLPILEHFGYYAKAEDKIQNMLILNIQYVLEKSQQADHQDAANRLHALKLLCSIELRAMPHALANISTPVANMLQDTSLEIRRLAAVALVRIIVAAVMQSTTNLAVAVSPTTSPEPFRAHAAQIKALMPTKSKELLLKLLRLSVTDPAPEVRDGVLRELIQYRELDQVLSDDVFLDVLFIATKDVVRSVRKLAYVLLGLLMPHNYTAVSPFLNNAVLSILEMIEVSPTQAFIMLLANIIRVAPTIARLHASAVLLVSIPLLAHPVISVDVLLMITELAQAGCKEVDAYVPQLVEKASVFLQDYTNNRARKVAVECLTQVQQTQAAAGNPFKLAKAIMPLVVKGLGREYIDKLRMKYLTLLGMFGVLPSSALVAEEQRAEQLLLSNVLDDFAMHELKGKEEYNAMAATNALLRVANDRRNFVQYEDVQRALVVLLKFSGNQCASAVPRIIRSFLYMINQASASQGEIEVPMKEFRNLLSYVNAADKAVLEELDGVIDLMTSLWTTHRASLLFLLEQLCLSFQDHIVPFLNRILPLLDEVLDCKYPTDAGLATPIRAMKILRIMSPFLADWTHFLAQVLAVAVSERNCCRLRGEAISTIGHVCMNTTFGKVVTPLILAVSSCFKEDELRSQAADIMAILAYQLGFDFILLGHAARINAILYNYNVSAISYERIVSSLHDEALLKLAFDGCNFSSLIVDDTPPPQVPQQPSLQVNQDNIRAAWDFNITGGEKAYADWFRRLSRVHIRESPSPPLRACSLVAERFQPLARELLNPAFVSCWWELYDELQEHIVLQMERIFKDPSPFCREIKLALLDLSHFMEFMNRGTLFVSEELLASAANSVRSFAKALIISERTFAVLIDPTTEQDDLDAKGNLLSVPKTPSQMSAKNSPDVPRRSDSTSNPAPAAAAPVSNVEVESVQARLQNCIQLLIELNNSLQQPDAARGILAYATKANLVGRSNVPAKWNELLGDWEGALSSYAADRSEPARLGELRCLVMLGRYKPVGDFVERLVANSTAGVPQIGPQAASAAAVAKVPLDYIKLGCMASICERDWTRLKGLVVPNSMDVDLLIAEAIVAVSERRYDDADRVIQSAKLILDSPLSLTLAENMDRGAPLMLQAEMLTELQEIMKYTTIMDAPQQAIMRLSWQHRLFSSQQAVQLWESILAVRSLVLKPTQQQECYVRLSSICLKENRLDRSEKFMSLLLGDLSKLSPQAPLPDGDPSIVYAYVKHEWFKDHAKAITMLRYLLGSLTCRPQNAEVKTLLSRMYCRLGRWTEQESEGKLNLTLLGEIVMYHQSAIENAPESNRAWHHLAFVNFSYVTQRELQQQEAHKLNPDVPSTVNAAEIESFVAEAIKGFFRSISLHSSLSLQDALRLMKLWFQYGHLPSVKTVIDEFRSEVPVDTWIDLIPQFVANMDASEAIVRNSISELLLDIGRKHPQAVLTPLLVAKKSPEASRSGEARNILERLRPTCRVLLQQTEDVCAELIRVSALWHEEWHAALQEASCLYFDDSNITATKKLMLPLHDKLNNPETPSELAFLASYKVCLDEARAWLLQHEKTNAKDDMNSAWSVYYSVFRRITRALPLLVKLGLESVSPKLMAMTDLSVVVPGTYLATSANVTISAFTPELTVISSKQRPRKLSLRGSDGRMYTYLLKGNEDPRMDERAMAFFGLVNQLLAASPETATQRLSIIRYSITPLSPRCGLIGWVPECDTLHSLVKQYRSDHKVSLYLEDAAKKKMAPETKDSTGRPSDRGFDNLPLINKVEVFRYALSQSTGDDLANIFRAKSPDTETWFKARTTFTTSLAVMSMVGYLLGLGDRHPSNLMLQRGTGRVVHIDFGDCFEVAQKREKYPERVPFRLTRMLIKAMELSGIEGTYRHTCERVMELLRDNKDSLMTVLDALARDPLLVWGPAAGAPASTSLADDGRLEIAGAVKGTKSRMNKSDPNSASNKALEIIRRVDSKLKGTDCDETTSLQTKDQVEFLIKMATSHFNLAQAFSGWCPFW